MKLRAIHTYYLLIPLFLFSSCSSGSKVKPEELPKEIKTRTEYAEDAPSYTLFQNAKRNYANQLYSVAKESFQSLRDSYPTGAYAEFSEIKIADCAFASGEFSQAAQLYEEFTKSRPISSSVPYALYKSAHSALLSHRGIGRDSSNLQKALELSDQLLNKYPESPYAEGTKKIKEAAHEKMAEYQRMVIDFYKKKSATGAYTAREEKFESQFGIESAKFEPKLNQLEIEDRSRTKPGSSAEALATPQMFAANISDGSISERTSSEGSLQQRRSTKASSTNRSRNAGDSRDETKIVARSLSCDSNSGMIFINLNRSLSEQIPHPVPNRDGTTFKFKAVRPSSDNGLSITCGRSGSLTLSSDGELKIDRAISVTASERSDLGSITVFALENPPRLVVAAPESNGSGQTIGDNSGDA